MSSLATSSPVSASTLAYLMRWAVFRLSWLNETFSDSDVAGYSATGQVTSERRRKPFQFARGAMVRNSNTDARFKTIWQACFRHWRRANLKHLWRLIVRSSGLLRTFRAAICRVPDIIFSHRG